MPAPPQPPRIVLTSQNRSGHPMLKFALQTAAPDRKVIQQLEALAAQHDVEFYSVGTMLGGTLTNAVGLWAQPDKHDALHADLTKLGFAIQDRRKP